jgi:hypothetical protein
MMKLLVTLTLALAACITEIPEVEETLEAQQPGPPAPPRGNDIGQTCILGSPAIFCRVGLVCVPEQPGSGIGRCQLPPPPPEEEEADAAPALD